MSTFIRQWQKHIIQARLGLHTSKLKYSKTHEEVIKRNKNCQSVQLRFKMNIDIANRINVSIHNMCMMLLTGSCRFQDFCFLQNLPQNTDTEHEGTQPL